MKSNKSATSISDDSDDASFALLGARGAMLLPEDSGPTTPQHDGGTAVGTALPVSPDAESPDAVSLEAVIAAGEAPLVLADAVSAPPVPLPAAETSDVGFGIQAQADTSLIRLDQFRADPRFSGIDGRGVSVVVLDTGIDLNHGFFGPDANNNGVSDRIVFSYNFTGSNSPNASDFNNHGSNVASIIGSQDGTYTGMAPGVNIIALKVLADNGFGTTADVAEALNWVVANRAAYNIVAVNMSLGYGDNLNAPTSSPFASQFATLAANNTAVVVSSGNSYANSQGVATPSADPNAWSIGAVWDRNAGNNYNWSTGAIDYTTGADHIISFSQRSASMTTIFAPGGMITGANYNGGTSTYSGTSQAAPHISGLVADMQQLALQVSGHFLSVAQLEQDMINGSVSIFDGDDENDNVLNSLATYHRVDALGWGIQVLADLFAGTTGNDTLNGTSVADAIHGNLGSDTLDGNGGDDTLDGDGGNDTIFGNSGNDLLDGGTGNDTLIGGTGSDTLTGSTGSDVFYYAVGYGADAVTDFSHAGGDKIDLTNIGSFSNLSDVFLFAGQVGADTVINVGGGDTLTLKNVDKAALVASDFLLTPPIESSGSTKLVQVGSTYSVYATGAPTGPQLHYGGAIVTAGMFGAWTPIGAEPNQVAWKLGSADLYTVWTTDSSGNYLSQTGGMSGSNLALQSFETSFSQDLNGDYTIGPVTTTIESVGVTDLVRVADTYSLYPLGGSTGPQLHYGRATVTLGMFGAWTPLGAEATGGGYQVAWKLGGADLYTVWTTDGSGNYLSQTDGVSGGSLTLQSFETGFGQDLNGDALIGPFTTTIESFGSTRLVQVADAYSLYATGGSSGPQLHYGGATVTLGMFGAWTPLGAEATAGGYQVAWKLGGADLYTVWTTDSSGNYLSQTDGASGGSLTLQSLETSFGQNLNGDTTIGPVTTAIELFGSTRLIQVADTYSLDPVVGPSGPQLHYGAATVTTGMFGAWTPIGAEVTTGGYQVAWKLGSTDQYTVWATDSSGNYLSQTGVLSGSSSALQAFETSFHQDLSNDGTISSATTLALAYEGWHL